MEYKALSQATYKFTTEVTINCNPLESLYVPKFGCMKAKYYTAGNTVILYSNILPAGSTSYSGSTPNITEVSSAPACTVGLSKCTVDGVDYLGTKSSNFYIFSIGTYTYYITGKLTVIKYNSTTTKIETNVYAINRTHDGRSGYLTMNIPKLSDDIILGITFEPTN